MEERIPLLRGKVGAEAKAMDKKLGDLMQEWEAGRPLSKEHTPAEVCHRSAKCCALLSLVNSSRCPPGFWYSCAMGIILGMVSMQYRAPRDGCIF